MGYLYYKSNDMIAFLGMGLLGSNFVKAMIKRGESVNVWNRTAAKAQALESDGAKAFTDVADAVRDADYVHITLKDDATVDDVLAQALAGLKPGAVIIDHTTTSPEGAVARSRDWKERGFAYQHAPVFMGPQNAADGTGFMLLSGDEALQDQLTPHLTPMTGRILPFGPVPGRAAAVKLIGNLYLVSMVTGLADALALAKATDVPVDSLQSLFGAWNPGNNLPARLAKMAGGDYEQPSWELNMARKDTQLFLDTAAKGGMELQLTPVIAALMDSWIAKGFGNNDWTVIGKGAI
jgi:3-hydroxyisobutyrate dehydrogenase